MIFDKGDALDSLANGKRWRVSEGVVTWMDESEQPTDAEIEAEVQRLQADYDAKQYQRNRANEYPSIGDQLDMIFKAGLGGDEFQAAIQEIKDKYPKPE